MLVSSENFKVAIYSLVLIAKKYCVIFRVFSAAECPLFNPSTGIYDNVPL